MVIRIIKNCTFGKGVSSTKQDYPVLIEITVFLLQNPPVVLHLREGRQARDITGQHDVTGGTRTWLILGQCCAQGIRTTSNGNIITISDCINEPGSPMF